MKRIIRLYMWGYQEHFAWKFANLSEKVFGELGVSLKPDVLLVGILKPEEKDRYSVCVEPEDGKWPLSLFSEIPSRYPETIKSHPLQRMVYGDAPSMEEKPEKIRRSSATIVVQQALEEFDRHNGVRSFCGSAQPVGSYYVVPVIQIPNEIFQQFPPLNLPDSGDRYQPKGEHSLIHSALYTLLDEASHDLLGPNPGRSLTSTMRSAHEIVGEAAERFMGIPDLLTAERRYGSGDLFQRLNILSSLFYEGREGLGSLILAEPDSSFLRYSVRFRTPVPLREPRWARKILQMASSEIALICSEGLIHGLGGIAADHSPEALDTFTVNFLDHYQRELRLGERPLMYSRYREPNLPQEPVSHDRLVTNYLRVFPLATASDVEVIWELFKACTMMTHGSMLVVAEDAETEAERLSDQGTPIQPVQMNHELLHSVSGIDGSILLDPKGICYAIGVILDGAATSDCSPARGSRFNSALRYVGKATVARLAIVVSDDKTVDLIPLLRPQIRKGEIEEKIVQLEKASADNYHAAQSWLDEHRFCFDEAQCERVNAALKRLENLPRDVGEIRYITSPFIANKELDATYFL
jgi:hypothetical protein